MRNGVAALIELEGADGSHWVVSGAGQGEQGVELDLSPQGLDDEAPISGIWQQGAYQEGATYLGHTIEPLDLILPFRIYGSDDEDWEDVESRFHMAWDEVKPTKIKVTRKGETRYLEVVKLENLRTTAPRDPGMYQRSIMTVTARAAWPSWRGDTVISAASTTLAKATLTVTIENPTDRPMWLQWVLTAPGKWKLPDFSWADDEYADKKITTPPLSAGQNLTIDTHPTREPYTATDKSNIAGRFGGVLFMHSVPPHTPPTDVPVEFDGPAGGGAVECRMEHNWRRSRGGRKR